MCLKNHYLNEKKALNGVHKKIFDRKILNVELAWIVYAGLNTGEECQEHSQGENGKPLFKILPGENPFIGEKSKILSGNQMSQPIRNYRSMLDDVIP